MLTSTILTNRGKRGLRLTASTGISGNTSGIVIGANAPRLASSSSSSALLLSLSPS